MTAPVFQTLEETLCRLAAFGTDQNLRDFLGEISQNEILARVSNRPPDHPPPIAFAASSRVRDLYYQPEHPPEHPDDGPANRPGTTAAERFKKVTTLIQRGMGFSSAAVWDQSVLSWLTMDLLDFSLIPLCVASLKDRDLVQRQSMVGDTQPQTPLERGVRVFRAQIPPNAEFPPDLVDLAIRTLRTLPREESAQLVDNLRGEFPEVFPLSCTFDDAVRTLQRIPQRVQPFTCDGELRA